MTGFYEELPKFRGAGRIASYPLFFANVREPFFTSDASLYSLERDGAGQEPWRDGLSLWPAGACLVTELVEELRRECPGERLADVTVVLPTKRLGNWFL